LPEVSCNQRANRFANGLAGQPRVRTTGEEMKKFCFTVLITTSLMVSSFAEAKDLPSLSDLLNAYISQDYHKTIDLIQLYPETVIQERVAIQYLEGQCYLKIGMNELAIDAFNKVLEKEQDNYELLNNIGVAYFQAKDYKKALEYFNRSFVSNTSFSIAQSNYNIALQQLKKVDEGVFLQPIDDNNVVLRASGWFYYYLGDLEQSTFYFKKAVVDKPSLSENYIALAFVLDDSRQYKQALEWLLKAQKMDPENPNIENNLGVLYYHVEDKIKAQEFFDKAIEHDASFAEPVNNKAFLLLENSNLIEAEHLFGKAVEINTYSMNLLAESLAGLSICQYELGKTDLAAITKKKALETNFRLSNTLYLQNYLQWNSQELDIWEKI
jgi:tetratricopeptide (TPR) repeat protein